MFYEGREKRLEIITQGVNLLNFSVEFWRAMVKQTGAYILSELNETNVRAFILSESSLFIWKNKLLLITCGTTHLLHAALYFKKQSPANSIKSLLFQRHHAYRPSAQRSTFAEDCTQLQTILPGQCWHWEDDYQGDLFQSHTHKMHNSTTNIVMLSTLRSDFAKCLQNTIVSTQTIEKNLQINSYFNAFKVQQHSFKPKGYSLNAVQDESYFTLHLSPEKYASYLSFETNLESKLSQPFIQHLVALFNPKNACMISFANKNNAEMHIKVLK